MCCDFPIACYLKLLTLSALCKSFVSSFNGQFKRFYIFTRWDYLLLPKFNPSRWCSNLSWYFNLSIYERKCLTWQISTSPVVDTTLRLSGLHSFKSKVQWSHLWLSSWGFFPYSPLLQAILLFLHQMVSTCLYWIFISLICSCCSSSLHCLRAWSCPFTQRIASWSIPTVSFFTGFSMSGSLFSYWQ